MYSKFIALFLLIGLAQQGFATNKHETPFADYLDYADSAIQAFATVSGSDNHVRGITYCKELLYEVVSSIGKTIELLVGFIPEAKEAWSNYSECNTVPEPAAVTVCKEATKLEYIDAAKTRLANFGAALRGTVVNAIKLPTCIISGN